MITTKTRTAILFCALILSGLVIHHVLATNHSIFYDVLKNEKEFILMEVPSNTGETTLFVVGKVYILDTYNHGNGRLLFDDEIEELKKSIDGQFDINFSYFDTQEFKIRRTLIQRARDLMRKALGL